MNLRTLAYFPLVAALAGAACDKIALFAPTGSSITLTAPKRTLALSETVEITAVVLENGGTPVQNGTSVRFTTTLGSVSPVEIETRNGIATATFEAGTVSGTAEVRASSGAAGSSSGGENAVATNLLTFTIGAAAVETVTVRANPSSVSGQGGTVSLTATVVSATGQGLGGVPVTFSASRGSLSASTATTNGNGSATVQLTTSLETTVTATAGTKTSSAVTITVLGTPLVTLTCAGTATAAATCSQVVDQVVSFTAARGTGSTPIQSATLAFGDGTTLALGTLSSSSTVTKTYSSTGNRTATLTATDINGESTSASVSVSITARATPAPLAVNIAAVAATAVATHGQSVAFTATVTPAADAALVSTYAWTFGDNSNATTTSGNITSHVYTVGTGGNGPKVVTVTITMQDGRTATGRTEIIVSGVT